MTALVFAAALFAQLQVPGRVQAGILVRPETVTVGSHFTVIARVRAPAGTNVTFARRPDSTAQVDTAAPMSVETRSAGGRVEATATYVLAAWDTGRVALTLPPARLTGAFGEREVPLVASVQVRSVLPADTTLRVPRPPRALIAVASSVWPWWLAGLLVGLIAGAGAVIAWRRWRRRREAPLAPAEWALRELARIDEAGWLASGDAARHAVAVSNVLRGYLERMSIAPASATTRELARELDGFPAVPAERVVGMLDEIDLVKFARAPMAAERARVLTDATRDVIRSVERALAAERARSAAGGGAGGTAAPRAA